MYNNSSRLCLLSSSLTVYSCARCLCNCVPVEVHIFRFLALFSQSVHVHIVCFFSVCPYTELLPGEPCGADDHGPCVNEHLCIDGYCSEYPTSPRSLTPSLSRNARSFPEYLEQLLKSPLCCFSVNSTNLCVYNDCPVWTACTNPTWPHGALAMNIWPHFDWPA